MRREHGSPLQARMYLSGGGAAEPLHLPTDEKSEFAFSGLSPGSWRLEARADEYGLDTVELELRAAVDSVHNFVLAAAVPAGAVSARVRSTTGTYRCQGELCLWGTEGNSINRRTHLEWKEVDGAWVSDARFEDIPVGRFRLVLMPQDSRFEILPAQEIELTPPAGPFEFEIQDAVPVSDIVFRARRSDTGSALEDFTLWYRPPNGWARTQTAQAGAAILAGYPRARPLTWIVGARGFQPSRGDEAKLRDSGDRRVADLALQPGWGAWFYVEETEGTGLAGISLLLDGTLVGPTDGEGRLFVCLSARPERLALATSGWRFAGGDVDPATGTFDDAQWWAIGLRLARE